MLDYDPVMISMVRKIMPRLIAKDIVGVQPIASDALAGVLRVAIERYKYIPKQGEIVHDLLRGWLVYYGTEYIPRSLWIKIKIAGY